VKRMELANRQLEAITAVKVSANRFSEQIAEFLLIGEPERADLEGSKDELEGAFKLLEDATRNEFAFLRVHERHQDGTDEFFRIERMRALHNEINQSAEQVFRLRDTGRRDEAISVFRRDIENRLDAELEHLLTAATLDEKEEVERRVREAAQLWKWLTWITAAATAVAIGVCLISGLLLARALHRPIKLLTEGTEAIGRGELDHRISYEGRSELGVLAQRFNEMAATQETQLALVRQAQTNLEAQVVERTRELATANRRLTDLDRLRVQFLADISHELRTPLTALRGEAEIAVRHGSKPEAVYRETLKRIVAQSEDMARLVDDLLFLARSETDTIRFEPSKVLLNELVRDAVSEGKVVGQVKNIAVQADYASDPIWITADPHRMRQALMILLDNAIKYSPPGRTVSICMKAADGCGEVAVRDQGVGIPAEELPHVFERFYRGRISSMSGRAGSGLGLAIAKWIVDKHGGEIALASEVGRYTEVRMRIPRTEVMSFAQSPAGRG